MTATNQPPTKEKTALSRQEIQSKSAQKEKPRVHLHLRVVKEGEVHRYFVLLGEGNDYRILRGNLSEKNRLEAMCRTLIYAYQVAPFGSQVQLHTPHQELWKMAEVLPKMPSRPELEAITHKQRLTIQRERTAPGLHGELLDAMASGRLPQQSGLFDGQLYTSIITEGHHTHVGALLLLKDRFVTWGNTIKGSDLTLGEMQAVNWCVGLLPQASSIEFYHETPLVNEIWVNPQKAAQVLREQSESNYNYLRKVSVNIGRKKISLRGGYRESASVLLAKLARSKAARQYVEGVL